MKSGYAAKVALLACTVLLGGCQPPLVKEAIADMRDARYVQTLETRRHRVEIRFLPPALLLLENSGKGSVRLSKKLLDSLRTSGSPHGLTFLMRILPQDSAVRRGFENDLLYGLMSGYANYQEASRALGFGLKDRIWIELEGERIPLASYHMENTYGMSPGRYFVLSFSNPAEGRRERLTLVLDDIVPGLARQKMIWNLPVGKYDYAI